MYPIFVETEASLVQHWGLETPPEASILTRTQSGNFTLQYQSRRKLQNTYVELLKPEQVLTLPRLEFRAKYSSNNSDFLKIVEEYKTQHSTPLNKKRFDTEIHMLKIHLPLTLTNSVFLRFDQRNQKAFKCLIIPGDHGPHAHGCYFFDFYYLKITRTVPLKYSSETASSKTV